MRYATDVALDADEVADVPRKLDSRRERIAQLESVELALSKRDAVAQEIAHDVREVTGGSDGASVERATYDRHRAEAV